MPGIERSCCSSSCATAWGHVASVSAADRYALILNALSPLISRRSAISPSTSDNARLSTPEPVAFEGVVEDARATSCQCVPDRIACGRRAVAKETPAAAGAADLRGGCARSHGTCDQVVDGGRRHAWCKTLAVVPLLGDCTTHVVPVAGRQRGSH